jgi:hypothetical protein
LNVQIKMIALAAFLLASVQASGLVTVSTLGESAETLLADLSKQTGLDLRVSDQLKSDIITCVVNQVPIDDLLSRLAIADRAEWKRDGATQWLIRSSALLTAQKEQETRESKQAIRKELERSARSIDRALAAADPNLGMNAFAQVCAGVIGASGLGSIPIDSRAVYSFTPTGRQLMLSDECAGPLVRILQRLGWPRGGNGSLRVLVSILRTGPCSLNVTPTVYLNDTLIARGVSFIQPAPDGSTSEPERPGDSSVPLDTKEVVQGLVKPSIV